MPINTSILIARGKVLRIGVINSRFIRPRVRFEGKDL